MILTLNQCPFVRRFHVSPADALVLWTQPVHSLLSHVIIQGEDWSVGQGEELQVVAVDPQDQELGLHGRKKQRLTWKQ